MIVPPTDRGGRKVGIRDRRGGEEEHNEGVPLWTLAALPFHHLLKERERRRGGSQTEERIDGEELPAVTL